HVHQVGVQVSLQHARITEGLISIYHPQLVFLVQQVVVPALCRHLPAVEETGWTVHEVNQAVGTRRRDRTARRESLGDVHQSNVRDAGLLPERGELSRPEEAVLNSSHATTRERTANAPNSRNCSRTAVR